jgi:hypothetical protein
MVHPLQRAFDSLNREIQALAIVLVLFVGVLVARVILLVYSEDIDEVWSLLPHLATVVASLLIARVANRVTVHADIGRANERNRDIVRTTHHLIAIAKDMRQRVGYLRTIFAEGGRPVVAMVQIAQSIEARYEVLLERDSYTYLPGNCVDLITRMSGDVYGIGVIAAGVNETLKGPAAALITVPPPEKNHGPIARLDALTKEIQALLDGLFALRRSIDEDG